MNTHYIDLFVDMDGVMARWNPSASVEETWQKGYFLNREPDLDVIYALSTVWWRLSGLVRFHVLSAVYNDDFAEEKRQWLRRATPDIWDSVLFVPYNEDKSKVVPADSKKAILLDDFTKNLIRWTAAGDRFSGIKYLNGLNDTHGTWSGSRVGKCSKGVLADDLTELLMRYYTEAMDYDFRTNERFER